MQTDTDNLDNFHFIEDCYRYYEQKLYQVAFCILRDPSSAEDAVQEAFLKLMKSGVCFEDVQSDDCKRYLITTIKHASINIYNRRRREQEVVRLSDQEELIADERAWEEPDLDRSALREMIAKLPDRYRKVLTCLVEEGLSTRETAQKLSISEATVRKRFERAKKKLRGRAKYGSGTSTCQSGVI